VVLETPNNTLQQITFIYWQIDDADGRLKTVARAVERPVVLKGRQLEGTARARQERFGAKAFDIERQLIQLDLYRKGE
jgi:hypothetical protein